MLDISASLILIIITAPLMIIVSVLILLTLVMPVFFQQERLGYLGKLFILYKFRTMGNERDDQGQLLPDAVRLTPVGKLLRKTSLDELPELFNVLIGNMSIVGPRPLLVEYRDLYTSEQWRRHEVTPGMAGPVVAYGRNLLTWEEKFKRDIWYVDNWSLCLDMKILFKTIFSVINARGINQPGHATVEFFEGKEAD